MARVLLAGVSSGCGKTTVTCGLLRCFQNRGLAVTSLKCGPDYIDPMFHRRVLGTASSNLDPFFLEGDMLRHLLGKKETGCDIAVLEGAMGYYDGIGFTDRCSSFTVAESTETPVILVADCKGMGASAGAVLRGFAEYRKPGRIRGVIFNRLASRLYPAAAEAAKEMGLIPLGYLPREKDWALESRHLGLVTAGEVHDLREKIDSLSRTMEETVDLDGVYRLARTAPPLTEPDPYPFPKETIPAKIAVAEDEAFCFLYPDNLRLLKRLGCTLLPFSPLRDKALPKGAGGLLLSGGYPELYAKALSENTEMRRAVREVVRDGMPCVAECGGFLYLQGSLVSEDGARFPMAGALPGTSRRGDRLRQFGYITVTAERDYLLAPAHRPLKAHEFHYWQTDCPGEDLRAVKEGGAGTWNCGIAGDSVYAGFPHFYFYGNPGMAERFAERCVSYELERTVQTDGTAG